MGLEVAGIITQVGSAVQHWKCGDRAMALLGGGGYASVVRVHSSLLMPIPADLSFTEAAAIPEVWLTAYQALCFIAGLNTAPPSSVLIHAGASGVGTAAIQLMCSYGHTVYVTAGSDEKLALCRDLGATGLINYKTQDFAEEVLKLTNGKGVNVILDFVAASYWNKNLHSLALDGKLVMLATLGGGSCSEADIGTVLRKRLTIHGSTLRTRELAYKKQLIAGLVF